MIRINRSQKKEFGAGNTTRILFSKLLLLIVFCSVLVSGCNSDSEADGVSAIVRSPANTLSIRSSNAEDVVNTVFSRSSQYFDVMERLFTALPDDGCPFGGSASIAIDDGGIAGRGEAGDFVRRKYMNCVFSDPIFKGSFNGEVMIEITEAGEDLVIDQRGNIFLGLNEDSFAAFEVDVDDFINTELDETTREAVATKLSVQGSANRDLKFTQRDFQRTDRSKGKSFTVSQLDEGSEFSNFDMLCQRRGIDSQILFSINASLSTFVVPSEPSSENALDSSTQDSNNVISSGSTEPTPDTVKINTITAFAALFDFAPDSGQLIVEGAQRSGLVLTALGSGSVQLQVDANGDGDFTDNNDLDEITTWTDIGVDFQGFCLN